MMYSVAKKGKRATRVADSFRSLRVEENRRLSSKAEGGNL